MDHWGIPRVEHFERRDVPRLRGTNELGIGSGRHRRSKDEAKGATVNALTPRLATASSIMMTGFVTFALAAITSIPLPSGFAPQTMAVGDFNGDGQVDVALCGNHEQLA